MFEKMHIPPLSKVFLGVLFLRVGGSGGHNKTEAGGDGVQDLHWCTETNLQAQEDAQYKYYI